MDTTITRLIGYLRVSTSEQADSGAGLAAQQTAVEAWVSHHHEHTLAEIITDGGASGENLDRPGMTEALQAIAAGKADGLIVSKLDRLGRSLQDLMDVAEWFARAGATLVVLDLNVDTSTPPGRLFLHVMGAVAEMERELIAQRTRDAMAAKRAAGQAISTPSVADRPELVARIREQRDLGLTYQQIADELNGEGVPTARGAALWRPSAVQASLGYRRPPAVRKRADLPTLPRRRRARAAR